MSRVAKKPIALPKGVDCQVQAGAITVKGPKGTLKIDAPEGVDIAIANGDIDARGRSDLQGALRALDGDRIGLDLAVDAFGKRDGFLRNTRHGFDLHGHP